MSQEIESFGAGLIKDSNLPVPEVATVNPLVIFDPEDRTKVGLIVTPTGDVVIEDQEVINRWAAQISKQMPELNDPPKPEEFRE